MHQLVAVLRPGPFGHVGVQRVLVGEARRLAGEARIGCPGPIADHRDQGLPFGLIEHRDGDPAVLAATGIDPVRRGVGMLQPVAGGKGRPAGRAAVGRHLQQHRAQKIDAGLDRRDVDLGALAGQVAMVDRHQERRGVEEGRLIVHVGQPPARGLLARQAADVRQPADRLHHGAIAAVFRMRTGMAETAHAGVDHARRQLVQVLVDQAPALHHPRREVLGDHAGRGDQPVGQGAALRRAHVDGHG